MGTYLYGALMVFFVTSLVGVFLPWSRGFDIAMAGFGVLLFSGYIIFDTHLLFNRLHVDDWVVACVSLYLECVPLPPDPSRRRRRRRAADSVLVSQHCQPLPPDPSSPLGRAGALSELVAGLVARLRLVLSLLLFLPSPFPCV